MSPDVLTRAAPAARGPREGRLREDSGMPAFTVSKRAAAPAEGSDQDPTAPEARQPPGSLTRKVILSALIGYFLLVPAITGLTRHVTPATVLVTAGTVAFAGLVGWRVVLRDRPGLGGVPWAWLAVMVALAAAVFAVGRGPGWLIILAVAAAACGRFTASVRPAVFGAVSCSGAGLIATGLQARPAEAGTMTLAIIVPSMAAFLAYASTKRNETLAELQQTRAELARVAVAGERLRIARDLHDLLGQSLSLITLKAELSRRMLDTDTTSAAREMAELEAVARQSLSDVREAVAGYRQPDLVAELGAARQLLAAAGLSCQISTPPDLVAELGAARQLLAAAGLSCQISTPPDLSLPAGVDTVLAWTVREGVTNVVRHARATCAGVTVTTADGQVTVGITDNGTGPLAGPAGSGLAGLSERVRQLGGNLMAGPAPAGGFRLQVTIPTGRQP
jgi:two-component system, NarL family, sensor histidine kinase DesK